MSNVNDLYKSVLALPVEILGKYSIKIYNTDQDNDNPVSWEMIALSVRNFTSLIQNDPTTWLSMELRG